MLEIPHVKIGALIMGCVVKSIPDHESYLVLISNTESLAYLPKKYADRPYKIGNNLVAAVFLLDNRKIILSQKCHQFYRGIVEYLVKPLILENKIQVRRAASVREAEFVKVAVQSLNGIDPIRECIPYLKDSQLYTRATITLVQFSEDIHQYIHNSMVPAPRDKIRRVIFSHGTGEARVTVDPAYYGLFVGKKGANVAAAAKLLGIKIFIKKDEQDIK